MVGKYRKEVENYGLVRLYTLHYMRFRLCHLEYNKLYYAIQLGRVTQTMTTLRPKVGLRSPPGVRLLAHNCAKQGAQKTT